MAQIAKPDYIRELGRIDIATVKDLTAKLSEAVWDLENRKKENDFDCFHHTRHIIFRFIEGMRDHRHFYSNPIWPVWENHLLPVFGEIADQYNFHEPVYPKVMLARLAAGGTIDRHSDGAGSNLYTHKIHIPLETNERATMSIRDRSFHLREGFAYEVNNLVPHSVENHGTSDRIHLIFEVFDRVDNL